MADIRKMLDDVMASDFTPTVHKKSYPAISPSRPELSQAGKSILITGGGTNIGKSIAEHYVRAQAENVVIVGRRLDTLTAAAAELNKTAQLQGSPAKVLPIAADVSEKDAIVKLFQELAQAHVLVDVLVLNAAKFSGGKPFLEAGVDALWSEVEVNFKGPMLMVEEFMKQNREKQKALINVTTAATHAYTHPLTVQMASYALSKSAGALFVQLLANQVPQEELQIISFHPGSIWNPAWPLPEDATEWDELSLPGAFAVWAASKEAAYLHGRTVWAAWDVEELAKGDNRKLIEEDGDFLRFSVVGFNGGRRAPAYNLAAQS